MAARMPMMAMTIMTSMRVNPPLGNQQIVFSASSSKLFLHMAQPFREGFDWLKIAISNRHQKMDITQLKSLFIPIPTNFQILSIAIRQRHFVFKYLNIRNASPYRNTMHAVRVSCVTRNNPSWDPSPPMPKYQFGAISDFRRSAHTPPDSSIRNVIK